MPVKKTTSKFRRAAAARSKTTAPKRNAAARSLKPGNGKVSHRRTNASTRTVAGERQNHKTFGKRTGRRTSTAAATDREERLKIAEAFRDEALFDYAAKASKPAMAKFWQTPDSD